MSRIAFGIPQADIARVIGIDADTLRKHFREELDTGMTRANARVATYLFEVATGQRGDGSAATTAAIFWCKTRLRWKETTVTEVELRPGELTAAEKSARALKHLNEVFGPADAAGMGQSMGQTAERA